MRRDQAVRLAATAAVLLIASSRLAAQPLVYTHFAGTAGGADAAYASVIDNVTNDPRTLLPR